MTRLANTFEGGTDGVTISTGNSGGASGNAFDGVSGAGSYVYDDDAPAPLVGLRSARLQAATGQTAILAFTTSWQTETEVFTRAYIYKTANPTSNTVILQLAASGVLGCDVRITSGGALQLRDGSQTARYTSAALADNTWHRVEWRVLHSTTVGRLEGRVYSGANVHGSTPDQTIGSSSTNWNTAASSNEFRFGIVTSPGTSGLTLYLDDVAIDDTAWIGSSVVDTSEPLGAVLNITATPSIGLEQAVIDWDPVLAADGYALEVEILDVGGDPAVETDWSPLGTFTTTTATDRTLTAVDGLDFGRSFRVRVRATTTDDD